MFESLSIWLPALIGGIVGLLVGQLSQWFALRRQHKDAIGKALSDVLEIRHQMLGIPLVIEYLTKGFSIPPESQGQLRVALDRVLPTDTDLSTRFGEAVTLVAARNPLLAFRLRSKDTAQPLLSTVRALAVAAGPSSAAAMTTIEARLLKELSSHFDELVKELSFRHGFLTWYRARRLLKRGVSIPEEFLNSLKGQLPNAS